MKHIIIVATLFMATACSPVNKQQHYSAFFDECAAKIGNAHGAFETCTTHAYNATR
jgi:hypothetical protein